MSLISSFGHWMAGFSGKSHFILREGFEKKNGSFLYDCLCSLVNNRMNNGVVVITNIGFPLVEHKLDAGVP
jgi:hypothetical protein